MRAVAGSLFALACFGCDAQGDNINPGSVPPVELADDWNGTPDCASNSTRKLVAQIAAENDVMELFLWSNPTEEQAIAAVQDYQAVVANKNGYGEPRQTINPESLELRTALTATYQAAEDAGIRCEELGLQFYCAKHLIGRWASYDEYAADNDEANPQQWAHIVETYWPALKAVEVQKNLFDEAQPALIKEAEDRRTALWDAAKDTIIYTMDTIVLDDKNTETKKVTCKANLMATAPGWGEAHQHIRYTVEVTSDDEPLATVWF